MECSIFRVCYRKRRVLLAILFAIFFWIAYLVLVFPDDEVANVNSGKSILAPSPLIKKEIRKQLPVVNVRQFAGKDSVIKLDVIKPEDGNHIHLNISFLNNGKKDIPVTQKGLQIVKQLQILKNKTLNLGSMFKEKLSHLGLISETRLVKHIKRKTVFNLTMSHEEYLHIIKSLIQTMNAPATKSPKSSKTSYSSRSCQCTNTACSCCVRLEVSKLKLKNVVCANITFLTKMRELFLVFSLDKQMIYNGTISAQVPPTICVGFASDSLEICSTFSNVTITVNKHETLKTQIDGCIDFSLVFFNRTLSSFPLGCFQIPDPIHKKYDISHDNWVL